ncbi:MAG: hypothetical protein ACRCUJ_01670 [Phocaeicola sp.]
MASYVLLRMDECLMGEVVSIWIDEQKPGALTFQKIEGSPAMVYCEISKKPDTEFLISKASKAVGCIPCDGSLPAHTVNRDIYSNDPQRMALLIDDERGTNLLYYWIQNGKPTPLTFQRAKTGPHLIGATFTVNSQQSYDFYTMGASGTGAKCQNITK